MVLPHGDLLPPLLLQPLGLDLLEVGALGLDACVTSLDLLLLLFAVFLVSLLRFQLEWFRLRLWHPPLLGTVASQGAVVDLLLRQLRLLPLAVLVPFLGGLLLWHWFRFFDDRDLFLKLLRRQVIIRWLGVRTARAVSLAGRQQLLVRLELAGERGRHVAALLALLHVREQVLELGRAVDVAVDQQRPAELQAHVLEVVRAHVATLQIAEVDAGESALHGEDVWARPQLLVEADARRRFLGLLNREAAGLEIEETAEFRKHEWEDTTLLRPLRIIAAVHEYVLLTRVTM